VPPTLSLAIILEFRPFLGFKSLRLKPAREAGGSGTRGAFCFAEFDAPAQAFVAMMGLQGYRMDPARAPDVRLHIEFAKATGRRE
jgi:hypothetical protein